MSDPRTYQFTVTPLWVLRHPDVDDNAVRVWGELHSYTYSDDSVFPSLDLMGRNLGKSEATIRRGIRTLEAIRAVMVEQRHDSTGRQTSNLYRLAGDTPLTPRPPRSDTPDHARSDSQEGATSDTRMRSRSNEIQKNENNNAPVAALPGLSMMVADEPVVVPFFDEWWLGYRAMAQVAGMQAGSRGAASIKWERLTRADRVAAAEGLARHRATLGHRSAVPNAATWLNQKRWNDDTLLSRPAGRPNDTFDETLASFRFDDAGNLIR